jgi:hypothetical protein
MQQSRRQEQDHSSDADADQAFHPDSGMQHDVTLRICSLLFMNHPYLGIEVFYDRH